MKDNITLVYSGDRMASINIGGECEYDQTASIFGTKGIIHVRQKCACSSVFLSPSCFKCCGAFHIGLYSTYKTILGFMINK